MNDQMEQVWRSKDGKATGSKEEVEAYLKSKNPLGKMKFPYRRLAAGIVVSGPEAASSTALQQELDGVLAFANLAPLIQEVLARWPEAYPNWKKQETKYWASHHLPVTELLLAYEEALKQVPQ